MDAGVRPLGSGNLVKAGQMGLAWGYEHCSGTLGGLGERSSPGTHGVRATDRIDWV